MVRLTFPCSLAGALWASPMPFGPFDPEKRLWEAYRRRGVRAVVVLASRAECVHRAGRDLVAWYTEQGLQVLHYPIPDFGVPNPATLPPTLDRVWAWLTGGTTVAVHCQAGRGRTGLFLAALGLRYLGLSPERALAWVRAHIPGAVETVAQVAYLRTHARHWRLPHPPCGANA